MGATILEHSKLHMIEKYYNFISKEFKDVRYVSVYAFLRNEVERKKKLMRKIFFRLCMTDTDSFLISSSTSEESIEEVLKRNRHHFDFSNLPQTHSLYNNEHKNELNR